MFITNVKMSGFTLQRRKRQTWLNSSNGHYTYRRTQCGIEHETSTMTVRFVCEFEVLQE